MAFRKKAGYILKHKPDILIVPECECPEKLIFAENISKPSDTLWFGTNKNKGLGIFSYSNYKFQFLDCHNPELKTIIPIAVTGEEFDFTLFAIWANNPDDADGQYVEQVWKALHHYKEYLSGKPVMLIGDFNSNTIWDKKYRQGNHSHVVQFLEEKEIFSCYHLHHKQIQGKEKHPTFYLYKHKDKPYHLDYCFVSSDMASKIQSVAIGTHKSWILHSDHTPVIVNFNNG